jgi:hypothetical protein
MTTYRPKFPLCVDGNNYRRPLKVPAHEAVSLQMDEIYASVDLSNPERANLLELHKRLSWSCSAILGTAPKHGPTLSEVQAEFWEFRRRNGLVPKGDSDDV